MEAIGVRAREREGELLAAKIERDAETRARRVYPNGTPRDLFEALKRRIVIEETAIRRARQNITRPAPENLPRMQPCRR